MAGPRNVRFLASRNDDQACSRDTIGHFAAWTESPPAPQPVVGRALHLRANKGVLSHFGFDTLRDLPDMEALEDADLPSKEPLLSGNLAPLRICQVAGEEDDVFDTANE